MSGRHAASIQEFSDLVESILAVADMLIFALAGGRAFTLESPDQTDILVGVLGDGDFLSFHHGRDAGVLAVLETLEKGLVRIGVEGGSGSSKAAGGTRVGVVLTVSLALGGIDEMVPGGGERA